MISRRELAYFSMIRLRLSPFGGLLAAVGLTPEQICHCGGGGRGRTSPWDAPFSPGVQNSREAARLIYLKGSRLKQRDMGVLIGGPPAALSRN
jgi:hypothetical protein